MQDANRWRAVAKALAEALEAVCEQSATDKGMCWCAWSKDDPRHLDCCDQVTSALGAYHAADGLTRGKEETAMEDESKLINSEKWSVPRPDCGIYTVNQHNDSLLRILSALTAQGDELRRTGK